MFTKDQIKALLLMAAKSDDPRIHLKGIYIESSGTQTIAVATDGHRMLVVRSPHPYGVSGILPREDAERMVKCAKKGYEELTAVDGVFSLGGVQAKLLGTDVARFPDWRRVIPDKISGKRGEYEASYVGDFGKAAILLGSYYSTSARTSANMAILHNDADRAAIIQFPGCSDAFGVLMPMTSAADYQKPIPDWMVPSA